jgi:hypothetical protein
LGKETDLPSLQNEIAMMRSCQHSNVVEYKDSYNFNNDLWVRLPAFQAVSLPLR